MNDKVQKKYISGYPVSYAQRRMWFLSRFESDSLLNNSSIEATLSGSLNVAYFKKALQILINRHESFRTNFIQTDDSSLVQILQPKSQVEINYFDYSKKNPAVRTCLEEAEKERNAGKIFNLSHDPLARISFVKRTRNEYWVLITLHHIISDVWTLAFFWNELSDIYQSLVEKRQLNLPQINFQYKDYSSWEQSDEYLQACAGQRKYWLKKLYNTPTFIKLPFDYLRPRVQTYRHRLVKAKFKIETVKKVDEICNNLNITYYTFFLSSFMMFLSKLSGKEDIIVGTYAVNRDQAELERVAGILLNNIAIRAEFEKQETVKKIFLAINKIVLSAMKNKDYPFEKLIDDLKIKREAAHSPLFNVVFQIFNRDIGLLEGTFPGFKKQIDFYNSNFFQHDLVIRVGIEDEKIGFDLNYNIDLFTDITAKALARAYCLFVDEVVLKLNQPFSKIGISFKQNKPKVFKLKCNQKKPEVQGDKNNLQNIEQQIMEIWKEVLGSEYVCRSDNFFYLGGHSLKLIQVHDRIEKLYPGKSSIADLFNYYTVDSLARHLVKDKRNQAPQKKKKTKTFSALLSEARESEKVIDEVVQSLLD